MGVLKTWAAAIQLLIRRRFRFKQFDDLVFNRECKELITDGDVMPNEVLLYVFFQERLYLLKVAQVDFLERAAYSADHQSVELSAVRRR